MVQSSKFHVCSSRQSAANRQSTQQLASVALSVHHVLSEHYYGCLSLAVGLVSVPSGRLLPLGVRPRQPEQHLHHHPPVAALQERGGLTTVWTEDTLI